MFYRILLSFLKLLKYEKVLTFSFDLMLHLLCLDLVVFVLMLLIRSYPLKYTCSIPKFFIFIHDRLGGVMVRVLAPSAEGRGFDPRPGQTKDFKIGICCFSTMHAALRSKCKDWLAQSQNDVSG